MGDGAQRVGGRDPDVTMLGFSGRVFTHRELDKDEEIHVQVTDSNGQVVAEGFGQVDAIAFRNQRDKKTKEITETLRLHTAKVT